MLGCDMSACRSVRSCPFVVSVQIQDQAYSGIGVLCCLVVSPRGLGLGSCWHTFLEECNGFFEGEVDCKFGWMCVFVCEYIAVF